MDPAYFSVFAALAGSTIGGLTSLGASWLTQVAQGRAQHLARESTKHEELYRDFIEEASTLYAHAIEHDSPDTSRLVGLYALVSRMRVLSPPSVVESADRVMRRIIDTYLAPNKALRDIVETLKNREAMEAMDPLREFSEACRQELRALV